MKTAIASMVAWLWLIVPYSGNPSAQERWVYRYNGPGNGADMAFSILMGADGNVYTGGGSVGSGTGEDFTIISLTPSGSERWVYRYASPGNGQDVVCSIVIGADSNLYVAGASEGSGTGRDFVTVSLTPSGVERWVYRYNGLGNGLDGASEIVVGADSNLYVSGISEGSGSSWDIIVVSLTPSGGERWVYRYNGPGNYDDLAQSIVMGADSNLYAVGYSWGSGTFFDITVVSLTPSGGERWVYRYNGAANHWDWATSITSGEDGNLYLAGGSVETGTAGDFTIISLSCSGVERWVYCYDGPANDYDGAGSIVAPADGNLYAVGSSTGSGTHDDFTVISLDTSGAERWVYRYNGPADSSDLANSIVIGTDGNLYVAGYSQEDQISDNFTVISLDTSGGERWVYRYSGPVSGRNRAYSIVAGTDGNVYGAGYSEGNGTSDDLTVISLFPDVGIEEKPEAGSKRQEARLQLSVSPVPALGSAQIHYTLAEASEVKLAIYDVSGKLIKNLVNTREEPGSKVVLWDGRDKAGDQVPSGTYFCRLTAGSFKATNKMTLLR